MTNVLQFSRQKKSSSRSVRPSIRKRGGVRVLLVEDHADTASAMSRLLRAQGFSVDYAATCSEAIHALEMTRYDLMVSDIGLPDGTGLDVMRHARAVGGITGIALSGLNTEHDIRRSKQAGFAIHITKPLNIQQLIESIERLTCATVI